MKNNAGYSLLEVVVSLAVSAIVLGGLYLVFQTGARMNARADQNLQEQQLVQNAAEYLLANGYDPALIVAADDTPLDSVVYNTPKPDDFNLGYYEVTISCPTPTPKANGSPADVSDSFRPELQFKVAIQPSPTPDPSAGD